MRVSISSAALLARKVKFDPSVYLVHAKMLDSGMVKYPTHYVVCKTFTIPTGYQDVSHEKLFSGQLPVHLVIGCVDNDAFNGTNDQKNPFDLKYFSLTELALYLDGQQQGIKHNSCKKGRRQKAFPGVFSVDTPPDKPRILVANTDESTKPGKHWIAIFVDEIGRREYFDSLGREPKGTFKRLMDEHCSAGTCNRRQLQSIISSF